MRKSLREYMASLRDADETSTDVVYVVQAEMGGPVKIGHTTWGARERRLAELQEGNPDLLVFRRIVDGESWLEKALHLIYGPWRLEGEWFDLCDDLYHLAPGVVGVEE